MKNVNFDALSSKDRELILAAQSAADNAYAPYSGFAVGAAVRATDGKIHIGANLENAAYGLGLCAEVSALTAANTAGEFDRLEEIAVVGFGFFSKMHVSEIVTSCGRCRQLISESAQLSGIDIEVFACSGDLRRIEQYRIAELLPRAFGPQSLQSSNPSKPTSASGRAIGGHKSHFDESLVVNSVVNYSGGEAYEATDFFSRGDGSVGCLQRP